VYILQRSELAILIPAYNEALTIERVVKEVSSYGQPIVVDDCSNDNTAIIAAAAGAIVVSHKINCGYDCALNSAFSKASRLGFLYVVTFDADGQHSAGIIAEYIKQFENGYDLILGNRPKTARFAEYIFSKYCRIRFGINDPLCGMKGYKMSVYKSHGCFDSYDSIGTELMLYSSREGLRIFQLPIPIFLRNDAPRFGTKFNANRRILRSMLIGMFKKN